MNILKQLCFKAIKINFKINLFTLKIFFHINNFFNFLNRGLVIKMILKIN